MGAEIFDLLRYYEQILLDRKLYGRKLKNNELWYYLGARDVVETLWNIYKRVLDEHEEPVDEDAKIIREVIEKTVAELNPKKEDVLQDSDFKRIVQSEDPESIKKFVRDLLSE